MCWKFAGSLTLHYWYSKLWQIAMAEKLTYQLKTDKGKTNMSDFYEIWHDFILFKNPTSIHALPQTMEKRLSTKYTEKYFRPCAMNDFVS